MPTLRITLIQADLQWHDPVANRNQFDDVIGGLKDSTDLIVLPEMFTTGFSMDAPALAEKMDGESLAWMQKWAIDKSAAICGSLIVVEDKNYYNRFICAKPDGTVATYDKRHLFRLADEHNHYTPGTDTTTFDLMGFKICPLVCYDLRFPAWSRNRDDNKYDLLLYVANWPSPRHNAWTTLLRARAIENLSFVAGVNRVGFDGNDLPYAGGSAVIDYLGKDMVDLGDTAGTASATINLEQLQKFRKRFAFDKDADNFSIRD